MKAAELLIITHRIFTKLWLISPKGKTARMFAKLMWKIEGNINIDKFVANNIIW